MLTTAHGEQLVANRVLRNSEHLAGQASCSICPCKELEEGEGRSDSTCEPWWAEELRNQGLERGVRGKEGSEGPGFLTFVFSFNKHRFSWALPYAQGRTFGCQAASVCAAITELWSSGSKKGLDRFREGKSMVAVKLGGLDATLVPESL